jgi:hypothetical protein
MKCIKSKITFNIHSFCNEKLDTIKFQGLNEMHPVVFVYNLLFLLRQNTTTIIVHIYFCTTYTCRWLS